jgi:hypothetical protein
MASRSNSRSASTPTPDIASAQNAMADLTRQQMATSASTASVMLRALDTFHQTQQHMLQRAALLQSQTAERLRAASTPTELIAVQSSLMLTGFSELTQYAQELMLASLKAQGEFMHPTEEQQATTANAANVAAPLFQAWQSVFTAPMTAAASSTAAAARHH